MASGTKTLSEARAEGRRWRSPSTAARPRSSSAGVLTLQLRLPTAHGQIVALLFSGDVFRSNFIPPHAEATLASARAGEVWWMRLAALDKLAASDPAVTRYLDLALESQLARQALNVATLGQFSCGQRVATLLVDLALRTGVSSLSGMAFELPFNRKDIADYLGLNSDTLSRIMSRLKTAGLIGHSERNRAVVRDFPALAARRRRRGRCSRSAAGVRIEPALGGAV